MIDVFFFLEQVVISGFAYGGLSEVKESDYLSCRLASLIAGKIGILGYKPSVLEDILIGNTAVVGTLIESYTRTFSGSCSPADLETALQVCYNKHLCYLSVTALEKLYFLS